MLILMWLWLLVWCVQAVENNSLRAVVQTVKIAGKLVQVVVKNGKVTIRYLKTILNKEKLDIIQDFRTITDGQLNLEDAQAVINLLTNRY